MVIFVKVSGDVAQLGAHMTGSHVVTGSNPVISTKRNEGRFPQKKRPFLLLSTIVRYQA
jgi:hypothetical protein